MTAEAIEAGPSHGPRPRGGERAAAHRAPHLQGQPVLRRPGRLRPPPLARTRPPRPQRRGHRRPAVPRARRRRRRAPSPSCPASTSTGSPDPFRTPEARRVPRLDRRPRGRHHVDRRLPRAADLLAARPPPSARPARRVRRRPRQPDARLRAAGRPRRARWSPPSTTPSPSTGSWSWTPPTDWQRRASVRRWYGFTRMQKRVARRLPSVLTVSGSSRQEIVDHLGVRAGPHPRRPHRRRHRPLLARPGGRRGARPDRHHLQRGRPAQGPRPPRRGARQAPYRAPRRAPRRRRQARRGRAGRRSHRAVRPRGRRRVRQGHHATPNSSTWCAAPQIACVPSLYEGFSLPAAEAMATGTPLVATTGGAIPEVAGPDGETCLAVPPGDAGALAAGAGPAAGRPGAAAPGSARPGRERVLARFTWAQGRRGHGRALPRGDRARRPPRRPAACPAPRRGPGTRRSAARAADAVPTPSRPHHVRPDRESRTTC